MPSPANISEEDVDPMDHEYEGPMPAAANNTAVEDVDPKMPSPTKINEEEFSATEKVESDGLYNGSGSENFGVSQATEIIPSNNSSAQGADSGRRKRKNVASQSSSPDSVASRTRRGIAQRLGKSPLSCRKDDDAEATVLDHTGNGGTEDNPVVVEEGPVLTSKPATKRQKLQLKAVKKTSGAARPSMDKIENTPGEASSKRNASGSLNQSDNYAQCLPETLSMSLKKISKDNVKLDAVKNVPTASSPKTMFSEPKTIPCYSKETQLAENAAPALDRTGQAPGEKPCVKKTPYFNSPSVPSFRLLDDEDDLGNYVEDPKLRRPVGTVSGTTCTSDENRGAITCHGGVPGNVQSDTSFHFQFCPGSRGWMFVDPMRSNAFCGGGDVSNQETDETERNDNVQTDLLHMVSLPFTNYSETPEASTATVPLAAISLSGEHHEIAPLATPLPCHRDVSVVGGSSLSAKSMGSNGLSNDSESLSNQGPWYSSSAKLALHRPKRLVIPSKYKLSPYMMPHSKIKVSKLEADVYDVVLRMAESEHSDLTVINYGHVIVKLSALASSLKPQGKVHYFVVNALCKLLFHREHPKNSYKHYFFSKVGDYFIGNHGPNDSKEKELYDNVVKCFKGAARARPLANSHYVPNFSLVWNDHVHVDMGFHGYKIIFADVPQQSENFSNDSGIFAMKNLELWDPNVFLKEKFSEADIGHLRIKYVNDMIFNDYYSSDDGRSKVMEYDAEVYEKYYKTT